MTDRLGEDLLDAAVIKTGSEAYHRRDGIGVIPAAPFLLAYPSSEAVSPSIACHDHRS